MVPTVHAEGRGNSCGSCLLAEALAEALFSLSGYRRRLHIPLPEAPRQHLGRKRRGRARGSTASDNLPAVSVEGPRKVRASLRAEASLFLLNLYVYQPPCFRQEESILACVPCRLLDPCLRNGWRQYIDVLAAGMQADDQHASGCLFSI